MHIDVSFLLDYYENLWGLRIRDLFAKNRYPRLTYIANHKKWQIEEYILEELNIGESYFFRFRSYYEYLANIFTHYRKTKHVSILSVGCSSGEEVYSLSFVLKNRKVPFSYEIIGIDINKKAITQANKGHYRNWSLRNCRAFEKKKYFKQSDNNTWIVKEEYREHIMFEQRNIFETIETSRYDVVFFCNVGLYFHTKAILKAYQLIHRIMKKDGILFIAPTDPQPPDRDWDLISHHHTLPFVYQKKDETKLHMDKQTTSNKAVTKNLINLRLHSPSRTPLKNFKTIALKTYQKTLQNHPNGPGDSFLRMIQRNIFFEPHNPFYRMLYAIYLEEKGFMERAKIEMKKAKKFAASQTSDIYIEKENISISPEELLQFIEYWEGLHEPLEYT